MYWNIIFPLFILVFAKEQLWFPGLSCTDINVSDLSDPPTDSFNMELRCIGDNSTLKSPTCLSLFSSTFTLKSPVSKFERQSVDSKINNLRAECENLKTGRQIFDFSSTLLNEVCQSKPRKLFNVDVFKIKNFSCNDWLLV